MIWYILYPFRGTTEPPRLSPSHPIRRAFHAHGAATARHWLLSILLTIILSVLLCYPAIFQTDSPAATGLRNLPKHAWTSTTEVVGEWPVDVEVRQVWVHGDYMRAIDVRVLRYALYVQHALIGNGFAEDAGGSHHAFAHDGDGCVANPSAGLSWGYHSPLMFWNCSLSSIENDPDLLATINSRSGHQSQLNLTLRPSTVFAGKTFSKKKLQAADALVITLFSRPNSEPAAIWDSRARALADDSSAEWSMFPKDGHVHKSRLYEFRFKPMTLNDDILLAASYLVTAAYVIWRMMQLRAVKSWFGLLITIGVKMTICVIGSFTVCTYLGIDLARIPRPWFPGVVFCFGLGNIFRLINVVLETPPELPPVQRIANAIGEVGHLSLAVAVQNLVLVYLCSRVVTPLVADFCVFAAVTLVLDFVFHLTFFLAVLSVDVQRMELQDSLQKVDLNQGSRKGKQVRQSWFGAVRQGNVPFSTRFAGSAAIVSIVLALNWHFFDGSGGEPLSYRTIVNRALSMRSKRAAPSLMSPPPINQARTPAEWLRIQDHNTAHELFGFIKPNAHSFIARVYDPLLVVLNGAKGRELSKTPTTLLNSLRLFAKEHAFPAALLVVFLIAGVTLLMNYLLWSGLPETTEEQEDEEELFTIKTLPTRQTLDIARLASCSRGHLVSIGLDRSTSIWQHERAGRFTHTLLQTATMKPKLWPIVACALDDNGMTLGLCSDAGQIGLWSFSSARFLLFPIIELRGQVPIIFAFTPTPGGPTEYERLNLIIVTPDGHLSKLETRTGIHHTKRICSSSILSANLFTDTKGDTSLVFVNKLGEVHILPLKQGDQWTSEVVAGLDPGPPPDSNPSKIRWIHSVSSLGLIFAIRAEEAELFGFSSRALVYNLQIGHVNPQSFRVMHSPRRLCSCGAPAVHSLTVAYTEQDTNYMLMQTFTTDETPTSLICLGKSSDRESHSCKGLESAVEKVYCVEPAGVWESTNALSVVGIRKVDHSSTSSSVASGYEGERFISAPGSALKLRATKEGKHPSLLTSVDSALERIGNRSQHSFAYSDDWEAWTLSSTGEFRAKPLASETTEDVDGLGMDEQLFIASAGPSTPLGQSSIAVGFGNSIKIISVGKESFGGISVTEGTAMDIGVRSYNWRGRRGTGRKLQ